tara:strand:+ start:156 stop:512 length:357 start_codon:yes stop_codon:yes gene_type:complete
MTSMPPKFTRQTGKWEQYIHYADDISPNVLGPWLVERVVSYSKNPPLHHLYVLHKDGNTFKSQSYEIQSHIKDNASDAEILCFCFTHGKLVKEDTWIWTQSSYEQWNNHNRDANNTTN